MRLLVVAMANSIHTARWLSQVAGQGWDIHLFPSIDDWIDVHPDIGNLTLHHSGCRPVGPNASGVRFRGVSVFRRAADVYRRRVSRNDVPGYRARQLARLIDRIRPDVVHSLEIQHAGYLTLEAKRLCRKPFPPWIVTNWGSDIYLFGRLDAHEPLIRGVLAGCGYYSCECQRDVCLAHAFGFRGTVLPVFPNGGGIDLDLAARLARPGPVSARRLVMLKGYQSFAGRALVGIRALERCADLLRSAGYEAAVYSAAPEVAIAAELFSKSTGVPVRIVPKDTPHAEILALHGQARVSLGLSISDAISTSLLEALVMGSFPVQSFTACADEWIEDGVTGLLVPPDDPDVVETALRRALSDDGLVDGAAVKNSSLAAERLDRRLLAPMAVGIYRTAADGRA